MCMCVYIHTHIHIFQLRRFHHHDSNNNLRENFCVFSFPKMSTVIARTELTLIPLFWYENIAFQISVNVEGKDPLVKGLAVKPYDLSLILEPTWWKERINRFSRVVLWSQYMLRHVILHTHTCIHPHTHRERHTHTHK